MDRPPLISVIIPFWNAERFLPETVESVRAQTYTNWELILVDDGSTDGSSAIARAYAAEKNGKIIYAAQPGGINKGVPCARNLGIEKARGGWIAFLDADDLWLPEKLEQQINLLQQQPEAEVLCESTLYWHSWHNPKAQDVSVPVGAEAGRLYHPPELAGRLYPVGKGIAPSMCGILAKTSLLKGIGGFDESFTGKNQLFEDQAFLFKLYLSARVFISPLCNNIYRQRDNSLMHSIKTEGYYFRGRLYFYRWLRSYLQQKNICDRSLQAKLEQNIFLYRHYRILKMIDRVKRKWSKWKKRLKGMTCDSNNRPIKGGDLTDHKKIK